MDQSRDRQILLRQEDQLRGISEWCLPLLLASRLLPKVGIYSEQIDQHLPEILAPSDCLERTWAFWTFHWRFRRRNLPRQALLRARSSRFDSPLLRQKCLLLNQVLPKNRYSVSKIYFYLKFLFGSDKVDVLGVILCEVDGLDRLDDLGNLKRVSLYINSGCGDSHFQKNKN